MKTCGMCSSARTKTRHITLDIDITNKKYKPFGYEKTLGFS